MKSLFESRSSSPLFEILKTDLNTFENKRMEEIVNCLKCNLSTLDHIVDVEIWNVNLNLN